MKKLFWVSVPALAMMVMASAASAGAFKFKIGAALKQCGTKCADKKAPPEDRKQYVECMKPINEVRKAKVAEVKSQGKAAIRAALKAFSTENKDKIKACQTPKMQEHSQCLRTCLAESKKGGSTTPAAAAAKPAAPEKAEAPAPEKAAPAAETPAAK